MQHFLCNQFEQARTSSFQELLPTIWGIHVSLAIGGCISVECMVASLYIYAFTIWWLQYVFVWVCVCDWQAQLCFHQVSDTVIQPGTEQYSCHSRTDRANYWRNKEHTFTFPHDRLPTYTVAILIIFNVLQEISHHANVCDLSSVCTPQPYLSQLILTNLTGCPRKSLWEVCL